MHSGHFALLKALCCMPPFSPSATSSHSRPALHSDQDPEGCIQLGLAKFHGKRLHDPSGQPVGLPMLMGKQIYLNFSLNLCSFNLCHLSLLSSHPSQNHRMAAARRDCWRSAGPTSLPLGKEIPQPSWETSPSPQ